MFIGWSMEKDRDLVLNKDQLEEINQVIIQRIEKYIDLRIKPIIKYFEKKKDFYEMNFL